MTSHATQLNEDILHIIFDHFDNLQWDRESARALVNTAMTCKGFHQPALRVIWRYLYDLFPLFELFSAFVKVRSLAPDSTPDEPHDDEEETDVYMIDGAIPPQEWERFRMHAQFVQRLGPCPLRSLSSSGRFRCIASPTLSYLGRLASGTPLLPHLRALVWHFTSTQCTALFPLISQSTDTFTMAVDHEGPITDDERREWCAFIRSTLFLVVSVSTHVTDMHLGWHEDYSIAEPVSQLQCLRRFSLTAEADANLLHVLAALPSLQELELDSIVISEHDTFLQASAGFLRLQCFSMEQHPNTTRFYQLFGAPCLRDLRASFRHMDDHRDVLACCIAWTQHFPLLEKLTLLVHLKHNADHHPRPYSSILEPLFQLRSLQTIDLDVSPGQFSPYDADIEAVSQSWPQLVSFCTAQHDHTLPSRMEEDTDPCIGPPALVSLALRCSQLRSLIIPRVKIDLQGIDALSNLPVLNHRLRTLYLRNVYSNEHALAALFIDRLFPHLQIVDPSRSGSTWRTVEHHIKICQAARQQQAQRTASNGHAAT